MNRVDCFLFRMCTLCIIMSNFSLVRRQHQLATNPVNLTATMVPPHPKIPSPPPMTPQGHVQYASIKELKQELNFAAAFDGANIDQIILNTMNVSVKGFKFIQNPFDINCSENEQIFGAKKIETAN